MRFHRALAALFVGGALALATLVPFGPTSRPLLAASSDCGGYSGSKCTETVSCVWWLFGRICTTTYTYYPGPDDPKEDDGSGSTPETGG